MALTEARDTEKRGATLRLVPLAAGAKVFQGGIVCWSSGYGVAGADSSGLVMAGIAQATVDNTAGQDGDLNVIVETDAEFLLKC